MISKGSLPMMMWTKMTLKMNNLAMVGNKDQTSLKTGYARKKTI